MRYWTFIVVVQIGVLFLGLGQYYFNLTNVLMEMDKTFITFCTIGIALISAATLVVSQKTYEWQWFMSDAVLSLGMVGTLFGFLMVLGQSLADIDTSSTESMTQAISLLASGMSTALVTSLVGLVCSLWLKLQLVILEGK